MVGFEEEGRKERREGGKAIKTKSIWLNVEKIVLTYGAEMGNFSYKKFGSSSGAVTLRFTFDHSGDKTISTRISPIGITI